MVGIGLLSAPTWAESTSSASSAASTSIGSSSTSIEKSSDSSTAKDRVAQGNYTIIAIATDGLKADTVRVALLGAAPGAGNTVNLTLPRIAVERANLTVGQTINATHRPYGLALSKLESAGGTAETFFLVLDDLWLRELESRPLGA